MGAKHISLALITCCLCSSGAWPASDERAPVLRFAPDVATAWQVDHADGDDYIPPESGPGPVTFDPAHPFVPTDPASSIQPTYRIADLTNPILKPWAVEQMRKANDEVLTGRSPMSRASAAGPRAFRPMCWSHRSTSRSSSRRRRKS